MIGIDLGTSNSSLCFLGADNKLTHLEVDQFVDEGRIGIQTLLPSLVFLATDFAENDNQSLPFWNYQSQWQLGKYAQDLGAKHCDRLIKSAKSWLCQQQVDQSEALLPVESALQELKLSPVKVSGLLVEYLLKAFGHLHASKDFKNEEVVVTIPASFDPLARQLTEKAMLAAGIGSLTLLEEPIAALYSWLYCHEEDWREMLQPGDTILICDVGGGTCDFSLVVAGEKDGFLELDRLSVGPHLLLGGDNIDLALAYMLRGKLEDQGHQIDDDLMLQLIVNSRFAKEAMLQNPDQGVYHISVAGGGSDLFSNTLTAELLRTEVEELLVSGFFPIVDRDDSISVTNSTGMQELGLNYEKDPAVSRHLLRFLQMSAEAVSSNREYSDLKTENGIIRPSKILFNGGVFKSQLLRQQVQKILCHWFGDTIPELAEVDLELAVSQGAAYFSKIKKEGSGVKIRTGTSHSYYIGIEENAMAVPGLKPAINGVCLVPQNTEEGSRLTLPHREFGLHVGKVCEFRFFSSATRTGDAVGQVVRQADKNLLESVKLQVTIPEISNNFGIVPVTLEAHLTEVGVLKIYICHTKSDQSWELEFDVRGKEAQAI